MDQMFKLGTAGNLNDYNQHMEINPYSNRLTAIIDYSSDATKIARIEN